MKICEIFESINGEGRHSGMRTIFIRTHGCDLRCSFCDSMYSVTGDDYKEMSVEEIMQEVAKYDCKRVTFTGGEPLIQEKAVILVLFLLIEGYSVEVETNGAIDLQPLLARCSTAHLTVTMDWKCPSSGMRDKMIPENLGKLYNKDVLKCVVGTQEDLEEVKSLVGKTQAQIYVSPVFGKIDPKDIAEFIIKNKLDDVRCQLQIHKILWPAEMRGV